jgi:hypothetical protein
LKLVPNPQILLTNVYRELKHHGSADFRITLRREM